MNRALEDCVFCKIVKGSIPATKVYEDEDVLAFEDLSPQAPVHVLVIPKQHAANLLEAAAMDDKILAALLRGAAKAAQAMGLEESGFRIISNCGPDARQSVEHLHIHVLGGEKMPAQMV